ncbi:PQQ-dependent sugar dehydrogenase [Nocardioides panacis]|uniref:PQQ-dependent sugar dehydrogenase n=1 Tax=Nocardioides panacis TaxID=2849501 RepID=A0A975T098_9ACTN|nr:PQQ-dependent sugar dehydrogenase [Nocardioides panacis]QWZ09253.1 PQQ-dependent sugar dehydrogenase [Nocardioides panacis]
MPAPSREAPRSTRRTLLRGAAVAPVAALLAACESSAPSSAPTPTAGGSAGTAGPSDVRRGPGAARTLATGIDVPWSIVFLPDGDALVSSRDTGRILRVAGDGRTQVVTTVPGVVSNVDQGGEGGLLGLALHPRFASDPWVYAYHSTSTDNRVVRMRYRDGRLDRPRLVLDGIRTSVHHNGGGLAFGPDGHLFVSTGDAESSASAQDRSSPNGKILRVTDTGGTPGGNPFRNPVWSYGHRNVEGLAFDGRGQLWASEFGDQATDELNRIERGGDYGWPAVEGADGPGGYRDPLATWDTDACSPSGIAVLHGRAWLGALRGECVYSVVLRGADRGRIRRYVEGHGRIRAVAAAPDGSLWVGTSNRDGRGTPRSGDDRILRVTFP